MKLSELISRYGDEKVQFQNLDHCAISLNMSGTTTKITFGTEQRLNPERMEKLGLIVWLDRDRVSEITKQSQSAAQGGWTKSDGGVEGHADPSSGRSSRASHLSRELEEAGIKPGPSDPPSQEASAPPIAGGR